MNGCINGVEKVLNRKVYAGITYYKLKLHGCEEPTWEREENCSCSKLINKYEKEIESYSKDEDDDEWEVEEILKKRIRNNKVEYLVKWKNWDGDPNWVKEKDCQCINLIAAFENPKLKKMWNFDGSNPRLWVDRNELLRYMRNYARQERCHVNILKFEDDFPITETPPILKDGLNIGPLCYRNHWYLVIVLINFVCVTKRLLVGDPLNTLVGVSNTRVHPVFKRLVGLFSTQSIPIRPISMTPMERSDMCAFSILAAFERALSLYCSRAKFVADKLFFENSRAEIIRSKIKPGSDGEISVALPISTAYLDGPQCEFCGALFDTHKLVNKHIELEHFYNRHSIHNSPSPSD